MKLLHLCPDYPNSDIYRELISRLDRSELPQTVYVPIKSETDNGRRADFSLPNTKYVYSKSYHDLDRPFYFRKLNKIRRDLLTKVDLDRSTLVHAHFLFSMGGIALMLKNEFDLDYVVSVRNVDVNVFFRYGFWLRKYAFSILKEASKIIFLSPSYLKRVTEDYLPRQNRKDIESKCVVLPNGVNQFWLENMNTSPRIRSEHEIRLVYTGNLNKNKNIETSIKVTEELVRRGFKATLKIAGKGPYERNIVNIAARSGGVIEYYGYVKDRNDLLKLLRQSDIYIMPSFAETFGVAYIEALTQGLPIIHSRREGVDGYFANGTVGFAVDPVDVRQIADRIGDIRADYERMSRRCMVEAAKFSWDRISAAYTSEILIPSLRR